MMRRERLVLDSNVLISSLLTSGSPSAQVLDRVITGGRVLLLTATTERELMALLDSAKFDKYVSREKRRHLLSRLEPFIERVTVFQIIRICRDPHDDAILEAAFNGRADTIVTGDKDLLELNPFRGIAIVSAGSYLARPESEPNRDH